MKGRVSKQFYLPFSFTPTTMRNTILLLTLVALIGLIPWMVSRNNHTATVHGSFPEELTGVDYNWVYLTSEEGVLDSCIVSKNRFELQTEVNQRQLAATIEIPCCSLSQGLTLRPDHKIEVRVSLDEYYRRKVEYALHEATARLDEHGLSIPDSLWMQMRDSVLKVFIEMQKE